MTDLTHTRLLKSMADLQKEIARGSEAIRKEAMRIDDEAQDTSRVGEMISAKGVDTATVGETRELSKIMRGLSEAAIAYASAGDNTEKAAAAAHAQASTTHNGIHEAVSRATVDTRGLDREWLRQE